ncbi:MAG: Undecaprenyl-phosphate 4-deoxy-4-formamido-L-arabinose transferase [bacterium ADurb.Bin478]|nr:MAG: Undecaprenyl-phosphate 4-deoxy-4-formamido-L-arabinose transferase [bacterium ADurb.Bin478]
MTPTKVKQSKSPAVSVIVAVQNQKESLAALHDQLLTLLRSGSRRFELIYVDDGSSDGTWGELARIQQSCSMVKAIRLRSSFGEASALDAGFRNSSGEVLVYFTCRVHVNPQHVIQLLSRIEQGYDVVVGRRTPRRDSRLNQLVSRLFNGLVNRISKTSLHDVNSGVLAARRVVLESVPFYGSLNPFLPVVAQRQGFKIVEEPVEQLTGRFNQSIYPKNYIKRMLDLISVLFLSRYSKKPLHFLGFVGVIFTLIGAAISLYLFIYRVLGVGGISGKPMLLLGVLLLIIGIQMISIGLLGEIIIFTHADSIKEYNIEEILN